MKRRLRRENHVPGVAVNRARDAYPSEVKTVYESFVSTLKAELVSRLEFPSG